MGYDIFVFTPRYPSSDWIGKNVCEMGNILGKHIAKSNGSNVTVNQSRLTTVKYDSSGATYGGNRSTNVMDPRHIPKATRAKLRQDSEKN
jgi:hypothetical protein